LTGRCHHVDSEPEDTINELKRQIEMVEGTLSYDQFLIYTGSLLEEETTLSYCSIQKESTIHTIKKVSGC
jgi:Ubiquitin family